MTSDETVLPSARTPRPVLQSDISALRRAAEAAYHIARNSMKGDGWRVLDRDLAVTSAQAVKMMSVSQGFADLAAIAQLWRDAKVRWDHTAANGMPPGVVADAVLSMQGAGTPPPASVPCGQAPRIITQLARRGIMLSLGEEGHIIAIPATLLNDADRATIRENAGELKQVLSSAEVVA